MNVVKALILSLLFFSSRSFGQSTSGPNDTQPAMISIGAYIHLLEQQSGLAFYCAPGIDTSRLIWRPGKIEYSQSLNYLLRKAGLTQQRFGKTIFLKLKPPPTPDQHQQARKEHQYTYSFIVVDQNGDSLPGTTVQIKHTNKIWQTDERGMLTISISEYRPILVFTHVGMNPQPIVDMSEGLMTIKMQKRYSLLDEIIFDGYITPNTSRRLLTADRSTWYRRPVNDIGTIQTALEGMIPGVLVTEINGVRGSSVYLNIHGQESIMNGSDPLYVIDGIAFVPGNKSLNNISSGIAGNSLSPFSLISLDDIERIDILKDADATAIYGSRGAGGVILITTQKGSPGKPHFHFQASTGISAITRSLPLMNTRQYLAMRRNAFSNDTLTLTMNTPNAQDLLIWDTTRYTNWNKWLIGRLAPTTSYQASFSGGNSRLSYLVSSNWLRETNVYLGTPAHDRLDNHFSFTWHNGNNKLQFQTSGIVGIDWNNQFILFDPTQLQFLAPNAPPPASLVDPSGRLIFTPDNVFYNNPLSSFREPYRAISHVLLAAAQVRYQLLPSLTFQSTFGGNNIRTREFGAAPVSAQPFSPQATGFGYYANTGYASRDLEGQLEYKASYKNLTLNWLAGGTWQLENDAMSSFTDTGLTNNANLIRSISDGKEIQDTSMKTAYDYQALFGHINANYKDMYLFNFTVRRDGSNRFGPSEQFGTFWSGGAAWIFSNTALFRENLPAISFGKLRVSDGLTGNDQIGDHQIPMPSVTTPLLFTGLPEFYQPSQVVTGRPWESIRKAEASLDLGFANDRILLSLTWYNNRTNHQLIAESLPQPGAVILYQNIRAVLVNEGWDAQLTAKIIDKNDVSWTVTVNGSLPVSRLAAYPGLAGSPYAENLVIGQPLTVVKGSHDLGVSPSTGLFQYTQKFGGNQPAATDMPVIGRLGISCFGGLYNTVRWKNIQFDFLLSGRHQVGTSYQAEIYSFNSPGTNQYGFYSNETKELTHAWQKPGDRSAYQKVTTNPATAAGIAAALYPQSDGVLTNASFIRLKTASVAYQLPKKILTRMHVSSATIFINTQNLFTLTPYKDVDPEIQSAAVTPLLRTVAIGARLSL